jgi:putative MATE family efflux protein
VGPRKLNRLDKFIANPKKAVWIVAAPMMAGFSVHALYSVVDAVFIGRLGANALAAATYIGAIFFLAIALTNGLATGITAKVAYASGKRDYELSSRIASNGLTLGIITGVVFGGLGIITGPLIIPALGADENTSQLAWQYMRPLFAGMPLFFISTSLRAVLNGEGDAARPMIVLGAATFINLIMDPVFMFVLNCGIGGAAYATLFSQGFALIAYIYMIFAGKRTVAKFKLSLMFPSSAHMGEIVKIGLPATAGHVVIAIGMAFINRVVASFGQTAVAGVGAGMKIDMIVMLPLVGLAAAAVTVVGMFSGASRPRLVRSTALYSYKWAVLTSLILGSFAYLLSRPLVGMFVTAPHALDIGTQYIGYMVFAYPLMAIGITSGRILQGLGYGMPSLFITFIRVIGIGVTGSYICVYLLNLPIVFIWISSIAGGVTASVLSLMWIKKYLWMDDPFISG